MADLARLHLETNHVLEPEDIDKLKEVMRSINELMTNKEPAFTPRPSAEPTTSPRQQRSFWDFAKQATRAPSHDTRSMATDTTLVETDLGADVKLGVHFC